MSTCCYLFEHPFKINSEEVSFEENSKQNKFLDLDTSCYIGIPGYKSDREESYANQTCFRFKLEI